MIGLAGLNFDVRLDDARAILRDVIVYRGRWEKRAHANLLKELKNTLNSNSMAIVEVNTHTQHTPRETTSKNNIAYSNSHLRALPTS